MLQKRGMGSRQQAQGTGKQWENEKWEQIRELEMNLLIGFGFQLDFLPIKIHINRHHDRLLTWRTKSNGSLPGNLASRVVISLLAYENSSTLQRLSFRSEIKMQMHNVDKVNPRTYKGGGDAIPSKVFLSFFLEDKRSAPDVFSSYSFISRTHFDRSSVIVSCYGYEIWRHK